MCIGCGGTCGPTPPRFTTNAGPADMVVIGTNAAPTMQPGHLIRQGPGVVSYERLYTGLDPSGQQAVYVHPGTFGITTQAGRGR